MLCAATDDGRRRVDPANADVVRAVDVVGHDGYPYWQGATIPQSNGVFWESVRNTRNAVNAIKVSRGTRALASSSTNDILKAMLTKL